METAPTTANEAAEAGLKASVEAGFISARKAAQIAFMWFIKPEVKPEDDNG